MSRAVARSHASAGAPAPAPARRPTRQRLVAIVVAVASLAAAGCGGSGGDQRTVTGPPGTTAAFAGFDIALFPGAAALQAWKFPASPYRWMSFYLAAPCHRDSSYMGQLPAITSAGWGIAALYVGQQDWANQGTRIPDRPGVAVQSPASDQAATSAAAPTCSASLLSTAQGASEAADAVAKLRAEGFAAGSTVYLDVEPVTAVSQPLLDYYRAWMLGVLSDGRYKPGVYVSRKNAPALHDVQLVTAAGAPYSPPFWVAAQGTLTTATIPSDVGLGYAEIWQAVFETARQYNGVTLQIDENVATKASPSSP